jgi:Antitoxin VbhA
MKPSKEEHRYFLAQALASARLEGHIPSPEFLADCEAVIEGKMTSDQARAAIIARAIGNPKVTDTPARTFAKRN